MTANLGVGADLGVRDSKSKPVGSVPKSRTGTVYQRSCGSHIACSMFYSAQTKTKSFFLGMEDRAYLARTHVRLENLPLWAPYRDYYPQTWSVAPNEVSYLLSPSGNARHS